MQRLLTVALMIVTVLPILIFATDFTNSRVLQSARRETGHESTQGTPEARRERVRQQRAQRRTTPGRIVQSVAFQLVLLIAIGAAGRKLFALRL